MKAHGKRVLIFNVREGWAPLLKHLEVDDPKLASEDFPRVNDVQSLKTVRRVMDFIALFLPLWPALLAYAIYAMTKKKLKTA